MRTRLLSPEMAIATTMTIGIIGMAFPYGFPLFSLVVIAWFTVLLLSSQLVFRFNMGFVLFLASVVMYGIGIAMSFGKIYEFVIEDLINIVGLFFLWPIIGGLNTSSFQRCVILIQRLSFWLLVPVAFFSLYKFYLLLNGVYIPFLIPSTGNLLDYPRTSILVKDYNMASFAMILGMVNAVFMYNRTKYVFWRMTYLVCSSAMAVVVIFAGSRRGWIALALIALYFVLILIRAFSRVIATKRLPRRLVSNIAIIALVMGIGGSYILTRIDFSAFSDPQVLNSVTYRFQLLTNQVNTSQGGLTSRTNLWLFGLSLINEYTPIEMLIGSGFDYLRAYGPLLNEEESYPHNPIISAFHYSGAIGSLLVTCVLAMTTLRSWNLQRVFKDNYLFLFMMVCLLFLLFSGNSIFSTKPFSLFLLLMLTIRLTSHAVILKEQSPSEGQLPLASQVHGGEAT